MPSQYEHLHTTPTVGRFAVDYTRYRFPTKTKVIVKFKGLLITDDKLKVLASLCRCFLYQRTHIRLQ